MNLYAADSVGLDPYYIHFPCHRTYLRMLMFSQININVEVSISDVRRE